ncbi:MAG: S-layer homology domain-containing protein [Candidatus Peribacteraceae bacterium]|jgi:hypothetical protein
MIMRRPWTFLCTLSLLLHGVAITPAFASIFPDVSEGNIYREAIESLVGAQVINGNPDGNFYPGRAVNRAEMLKMLYKAKGKLPDPTSRNCFKDVEEGSWYEQYVCDAAANRYVQGYNDGTFRPSTLVNRVEALKMIAEVFGIEVANISEYDRDIINFVDVSPAAWYTKYLYSAFIKGILPIPGQEGTRFYPDWPLLRGEAAAYIFNALRVQLNEDRRTNDDTDDTTNDEDDTGQTSSTSSASSIGVEAMVIDTTFPFTKSGKFTQKDPYSFRFTLAKSMIVSTTVSLQSGQQGAVSCRLYLLGESSFSSEYYLGYQSGRYCYLRTALRAGSYQLQLQPTVADVTFDVATEESIGDGNDGFVQAMIIKKDETKTNTLTANDLEDYYKFTVSEKTNMTVDIGNSAELRCIIYSMADVDLFGFTGPECNQSYQYPTGTYYIGIGRKAPKASSQTYTVQLR